MRRDGGSERKKLFGFIPLGKTRYRTVDGTSPNHGSSGLWKMASIAASASPFIVAAIENRQTQGISLEDLAKQQRQTLADAEAICTQQMKALTSKDVQNTMQLGIILRQLERTQASLARAYDNLERQLQQTLPHPAITKPKDGQDDGVVPNPADLASQSGAQKTLPLRVLSPKEAYDLATDLHKTYSLLRKGASQVIITSNKRQINVQSVANGIAGLQGIVEWLGNECKRLRDAYSPA